jgi:hypothetical protein
MRYCTYLSDIKLVIISTEGTVNLPGRGRGGWGGALGGLAVIMSWEGDRGLQWTCSSPDFATGHAGGELAVIVSWQRGGGYGTGRGWQSHRELGRREGARMDLFWPLFCHRAGYERLAVIEGFEQRGGH